MWWMALAMAGPENSIERLLRDGEIEKAQQKCARLDARAPSQPRALREVCANAMWHDAKAQNTYAAWAAFTVAWKGTARAVEAHENAASAKLSVIGEKAASSTYAAFLEEFGDTQAAPRAKALMSRAALRGIDSLDEARKAAVDFSGDPALGPALQPWFDQFVNVQVRGDAIEASLEPKFELPDAELKAAWAGRIGDTVLPLDKAAARHLGDLGVPEGHIRQYAKKDEVPYPPCTVHDLEIGVQVTLSPLTAFVPQNRPCGGNSPTFVAEEAGRLTGLTLEGGHSIRFGNGTSPTLEWVGDDDTRTAIPLLGDRKPSVIKVGTLLGQQVGALWLLHPIAGGMPFYVNEEPPPNAKPLPDTLVSVPVPSDVQLIGTAVGDTRLEKPGDPKWTRSLPAGKVRVMSPWLAEILGLHDKNKAMGRKHLDPLPRGFTPNWKPLPDVVEREKIRVALEGFGIALDRAWTVALQSDGKSEVVFEGRFKNDTVRGVLDPRRGGWRLFVYHADPAGDPLTFERQGRTWVAFRTPKGLETLCYEERGLIRRMRR